MKTLCFGSLNIDNVYDVPHFVARGETLAAGALNIFSGGKGLNQSVALARAGLEIFHAGAIGSDGQFLLDELAQAGVDTRYTAVLESTRTGHAIIQKGPDGDNCILLFGGANQQITRDQIDRTLENFSAGDLLVLQNEISELHYLVSAAKSRGMTVALNPSPMEASLLPLLTQVDYLILNEIEAAQFLGLERAGDPEEMLDELEEPSLVSLFSSYGPVVAVGIDLRTDESTESGFWWSGRKGKTVRMVDGTPVSCDIIVDRKAPITMVIPSLKDTLTVKQAGN